MTGLFRKLLYLEGFQTSELYALPHRCEHIDGLGDVILSGDPGQATGSLATGEHGDPLATWIQKFYRAINPHSGCYFLAGEKLGWETTGKNRIRLQISSLRPLEQAGSGLLLPI